MKQCLSPATDHVRLLSPDRGPVVLHRSPSELRRRGPCRQGPLLFRWQLPALPVPDPFLPSTLGRSQRDDVREIWPKLTGLRWMHSASAGLEHLLFPELIESPVVLTNAQGVYSNSLAEYAIFCCKYFALDFNRIAGESGAPLRPPGPHAPDQLAAPCCSGQEGQDLGPIRGGGAPGEDPRCRRTRRHWLGGGQVSFLGCPPTAWLQHPHLHGIVCTQDRDPCRLARANRMRTLGLRRRTDLTEEERREGLVEMIFPPDRIVDMVRECDYIVRPSCACPGRRWACVAPGAAEQMDAARCFDDS